MLADVETKLAAARTRLILDRPFLGAMVMRMPLIEADPRWCRTSATDAKSIYYNPDYVNELSLNQVIFLLSHEALHCALSHFARRQHRDKARWDVASDLAVNPILIDEGLSPTPDALFLDEFRGMGVEEIYPMIDEHNDLNPQDEHIYDEDESEGGTQGEEGGADSGPARPQGGGGDGASKEQQGSGAGRPPPLTPQQREELAQQWAQRMAGAAQQALQAGKLSGPMQRLVDALLQPKLPWRSLLARYMTATARDDYSYSRPSRREGAAIMPSMKSHEIKVVVVLDTSGSVADGELSAFVSEVNALKGQIHARVTLLGCDNVLCGAGPWTFEPWDEFQLPAGLTGGGGTDFRPPFEWLARQDSAPDLLVYFTDGQGRYPQQQPHYPVVWLIKGKQQPPWGERIQLN